MGKWLALNSPMGSDNGTGKTGLWGGLEPVEARQTLQLINIARR